VRFVGFRLSSALLLAASIAAALGAGCHPEHVGRPCDLGTGDNGYSPGDVVTIASPAVECPSGICLGPSDTNTRAIGPVCTASCESNDDCADGEIARAGDPSDRRCRGGFACMWPTTVGNFACRKLCVCRDLFPEPDGGFRKPAVCP
jgi:hypothetical protein